MSSTRPHHSSSHSVPVDATHTSQAPIHSNHHHHTLTSEEIDVLAPTVATLCGIPEHSELLSNTEGDPEAHLMSVHVVPHPAHHSSSSASSSSSSSSSSSTSSSPSLSPHPVGNWLFDDGSSGGSTSDGSGGCVTSRSTDHPLGNTHAEVDHHLLYVSPRDPSSSWSAPASSSPSPVVPENMEDVHHLHHQLQPPPQQPPPQPQQRHHRHRTGSGSGHQRLLSSSSHAPPPASQSRFWGASVVQADGQLSPPTQTSTPVTPSDHVVVVSSGDSVAVSPSTQTSTQSSTPSVATLPRSTSLVDHVRALLFSPSSSSSSSSTSSFAASFAAWRNSKKKASSQQMSKREKKIAELTELWRELLGPTNTIAPKLRHSRKLQQLCWEGIPPAVRCDAWPAIVGNSLRVTRELFEIMVQKGNKLIAQQEEAERELAAKLQILHAARYPSDHTAPQSPSTASVEVSASNSPTHGDSNNFRSQQPSIVMSASAPSFLDIKSTNVLPIASLSPTQTCASISETYWEQKQESPHLPTTATTTTTATATTATTATATTATASNTPTNPTINPTNPTSSATPPPITVTTTNAGDVPDDINKESSLSIIKADIPRTFPTLKIFHEGGPLYSPLLEVLQAYVCYRPDVGYVQGQSYLASMLLLNLDVYSSFCCLVNLLHQDMYFDFFRMDVEIMRVYFSVYDHFFHQKMPALQQHFAKLDVTSSMYLFEWLFTIFSRSLPLDIAHRVFDNVLFHGPVFLFRTALGLVRHFSSELMTGTFDSVLRLLQHIPANLDEEALFLSIAQVSISAEQFAEVFVSLRNA